MNLRSVALKHNYNMQQQMLNMYFKVNTGDGINGIWESLIEQSAAQKPLS